MCEIPSDIKPQFISVGELSVESRPSKDILWKIPNFLALPKKVDFWIYSPLFTVADATWCLQIFPNGQTQESTDGWIDLLLLRLHPNNSTHVVWYKLGIIASNGKTYESFSDVSTFKETEVEWGVAHLIKRSQTLDNQLLISKDGTLFVCCEIEVAEVKSHPVLFESPNSSTVEMPEYLKRGELFEQCIPKVDIVWKIPHAFDLLDKKESLVQSSSFNFADASWCLQIYLIKEENEEDSWLSLKLEKLCSTYLHYEINFTLGIKNCSGEIYKKFSDKRVFWKKLKKWKDIKYLNRSIDQTCSVIAPNGCVTAFCQMYIKDQTHTSFSQSFGYKETMGILDHSQQFHTETALSGTENIEWKLKFSELPAEEDKFADSPEFFFGNAIWCLQFYPSGKKGDYNEWMQLFLLRLQSPCSVHHIHYRLGLKVREHKEYATFIHEAYFHSDCAQSGVVNLLKRSDAIKSHKFYFPNDFLTVFCEILQVEDLMTALYNQPKCSKPFRVQPLQILESSQQSSITKVNSLEDVFMYLDIKMFPAIPTDVNCFIESEKFVMANASWCLRLYPNGKKKENRGINPKMHLLLVRLCSDNPFHFIHYKFGLMILSKDAIRGRKRAENKGRMELNSFIHAAAINDNDLEFGVTNLTKRSDIEKTEKMFLTEDSLTAFCQIWIIGEKTQSLSNPTVDPKLLCDSPAPEIQMSKYFNFGILPKKLGLDAIEVIWKILSTHVESKEIGHAIDSPLFFFMNDYWRLQMLACARKNNNLHGSLELCLIKLNTPSSFSYEVNLKMFINDSWQDFETSFPKGVFNTNVLRLGLTDIHFASDGYLKIHCQLIMLSKNEKASNQSKVQNQGTSWVQWGVLQELSFLESAQITWTTFDFSAFEKTYESFSYVNSPPFELAKNTWMLQLYPNGLNRKSEQMCIMLVRLFSNAADYDVICEFYDREPISKSLLCKNRSTFRGRCTKSCLAVLDLQTVRKAQSIKPLSLICRIFISENCEKSSIEIPLTEKNLKPLSSK